jgi:DNA-binding NtrC family response regulator
MMATPKSILVIDDDDNVRRTLELILQRAGYHVVTTGAACEAVGHLRVENFDLVFLDIKMQDIDGLSLLPKIQLVFPQLPVLILTASYLNSETATCVEKSQAHHKFLVKPVEPDRLLGCVREILSMSKQR